MVESKEDTRDRCLCTACGYETDRERLCYICGAKNPEAWEITCGECDGAGSVRFPLDLAVDYFGGWRTADCPRCLGNKTVDAPFLSEAEAFEAEWKLAEEHTSFLPTSRQYAIRSAPNQSQWNCRVCGRPAASGETCNVCFEWWLNFYRHPGILVSALRAAEARRK